MNEKELFHLLSPLIECLMLALHYRRAAIYDPRPEQGKKTKRKEEEEEGAGVTKRLGRGSGTGGTFKQRGASID